MRLIVTFKRLLLLAGICALCGPSMAADIHSQLTARGYEPAVLEVIQTIQSGELEIALQKVEQHLTAFPKSRIGHLLKADILQAMSEPLATIGEALQKEAQFLGLKHQLENRWRHANVSANTAHQLFPSSLLDMGDNEHVLVADMTEGRLYLYRNDQGQPVLLRDYYMSVGSAGFGKQVEGDNKTPVGVYSIYRYIDDAELPDLYGDGAFPVDYPNRLDRYRQRTGYGIWLHGTPSNTYARSPWASEGCFVISNDDFQDIEGFISVENRTPVILSDQVEWVSNSQLQQRRQEYLSIVHRWREAWESLHTESYLAHYSQHEFNFGADKFEPWAQRKRQVNNAKTFVQVDLEVQSLFVYPGEKDMFVIKYRQRYLSNNFHSSSEKEQYWQRNESGQWRIVYEG